MRLARAACFATAIVPSVTALVCAVGCAGAPPAPVAPAVETRPLPPPPPPPVAEVGAVADPANLLVSGRLGKPAAVLAVVRDWSGLPTPQSEEVTQFVLGEPAGAIVDLDQPVDFAMSTSGAGTHLGVVGAVSMAIGDPERAKASLAEHFKLVASDNGVSLLQEQGEPSAKEDSKDDDDEDRNRACEIAPAFGPAPMRLVCGWGPKALSLLGPWLTRTATRRAAPSDVHVDLRMEPIRSTILAEKRFAGTVLGSMFPFVGLASQSMHELVSSVLGDVVDFAVDLDGATLDGLARDEAAAATATLKFAGHTSALSRLVTSHAERSAPAPAAFWELPGDADFALFERGVDETDLARGRQLLLHVFDEGFEQVGLKEADRRPIVDALGKIASTSPLVMARGLDWDAAKKAIAAEKALREVAGATGLDEAQRAASQAMIGWFLVEMDESSTRLATAFKDLVTAQGRPGVLATLRAKDPSTPSVHTAVMPKGATLPPASQHYVVEFPTEPPSDGKVKTATVRKPVLAHVFVTGDSTHTWVGVGGDELGVASKLAAALATGGDKLSGRSELAPLKSSSLGSGGFVTVRNLGLATVHSGSEGGAMRKMDEWAHLPHGGKVGMPFSLTALSDSQVTASIEVPKSAIEDIVRLLMRHGL